MKKIILPVLLLLIIQSFFVIEAKGNAMNNVMNSWNGQNISSVINVWGQPSQITNTETGSIYYWIKSEQITTATGKSYNKSKIYCMKVLETDKEGMIKSWEYKGASCPKQNTTTKMLRNPDAN